MTPDDLAIFTYTYMACRQAENEQPLGEESLRLLGGIRVPEFVQDLFK